MNREDVCPICGHAAFLDFLPLNDESVSKERFVIRKCEGCDLLATSPRPNPEQLPKYYQSETYISHTSKARSAIDTIYLIARKFTLRWKERLISKQTRNRTLLDYGCGTGDFLKYCQSEGWRTEGVEPSAPARQLAIEKNLSVKADIEDIDQQFDVITLWHVLEHVTDLNDTLNKLIHHLVPTGRLIIAVPNPNSWDSAYYREKWAAYDVPRHLWHFKKANMCQLLLNHSFHLHEVHPMPLDAYYVSLMSERYRSKNGLTIGAAVKGLLNGLKSNRKASMTGEYSSMIYVFKR